MKLKVLRNKKSLLTVFTGLISELSQGKPTLLKGGTDNCTLSEVFRDNNWLPEARRDSGNIKYCTLIVIVMVSVFILSDLQSVQFLG